MDRFNDRLRKNPRVTWRPLEGECILLHLDTGFYYTLNPSGRFLWESLDGQKSVAQIHQALLEEYEIDGDSAKRDLLQIVDDLIKEDLISVDR